MAFGKVFMLLVVLSLSGCATGSFCLVDIDLRTPEQITAAQPVATTGTERTLGWYRPILNLLEITRGRIRFLIVECKKENCN
jgi:hypothetical protein